MSKIPNKNEIEEIVNKSFYDLGYKKKYSKEYYTELVNNTLDSIDWDTKTKDGTEVIETEKCSKPHITSLSYDNRYTDPIKLNERKKAIEESIMHLEADLRFRDNTEFLQRQVDNCTTSQEQIDKDRERQEGFIRSEMEEISSSLENFVNNMYDYDSETNTRSTKSEVKAKFEANGLGADFDKIQDSLDTLHQELPSFFKSVETALKNGDTTFDVNKFKYIESVVGTLEKYGTHAFWEQGKGLGDDYPVVFYVNGLDDLGIMTATLGQMNTGFGEKGYMQSYDRRYNELEVEKQEYSDRLKKTTKEVNQINSQLDDLYKELEKIPKVE